MRYFDLYHVEELQPTQVVGAAAAAPVGMIEIPGGDFVFEVEGVEIKVVDDPSVDGQCPWENAPQWDHERLLPLKPFWIDKYLVTNRDFDKSMQSTHYRPKDDSTFLRDCIDGEFPDGSAHKPVTWESRKDARAYAAWEWQYSPQEADCRTYPWDDEWSSSAFQLSDKGRTLRSPEEATTHPPGASSGAIGFRCTMDSA